MKKLKLTLTAAALAGTISTSAQVDVTIDTPNPSQLVNLTVTPSGGSGVAPFSSGGVYAGIYNETVNGVFTPSFCIDVAHDVYIGETFTDYSYAALADAPDTPAGPMGAPTAIAIEKLWAAYYTSAQADATGVTAAALQVAIWETEGGGQTLGNGDPGYTVTESDGAGVSALAASMLSAVRGGGLSAVQGLSAQADLIALVSPDGQSYVVAVPEPATIVAGALVLLPFGTSMVRILRRNRAA